MTVNGHGAAAEHENLFLPTKNSLLPWQIFRSAYNEIASV